ncbi:B-cell lymphoma/leukemia 10 isoform X2 [Rhinatrema bivittatum]|uniref:B-cell lymphoma/leukemia 10 isoform X2 n=1 Tax=Rhinatrema bivittatum TaxID=194408 RepID=UPI00112DF6B2|nr:B-cell lymphoma/leukemia 10 isoform X2 [Rhinatrema bivittatum]
MVQERKATLKAVEKLRPYLSERIIAERHFDYLRSKKILTREDAEEISCQTTSKKKAGALFDCIVQNPKGLDALIESIRKEKTQNFLIEKITDEVQRLKNEKLELFKGLNCTVCGPLPYEATNDLSRAYSECNLYESTVLFHPEDLNVHAGPSRCSLAKHGPCRGIALNYVLFNLWSCRFNIVSPDSALN